MKYFSLKVITNSYSVIQQQIIRINKYYLMVEYILTLLPLSYFRKLFQISIVFEQNRCGYFNVLVKTKQQKMGINQSQWFKEVSRRNQIAENYDNKYFRQAKFQNYIYHGFLILQYLFGIPQYQQVQNIIIDWSFYINQLMNVIISMRIKDKCFLIKYVKSFHIKQKIFDFFYCFCIIFVFYEILQFLRHLIILQYIYIYIFILLIYYHCKLQSLDLHNHNYQNYYFIIYFINNNMNRFLRIFNNRHYRITNNFLRFNFSQIKPEEPKTNPVPGQSPINNNQQQSTKQAKPELTTQQIELVEKMMQIHKGNSKSKYLNILISGDENKSFMKDIVISKKDYKDKRNTKELKDAILYDEILKNQVDILIYDTNGRIYFRELALLIAVIVTGISSYFLYRNAMADKQARLILQKTRQGKWTTKANIVLITLLSMIALKRYRRIQKFTVQKIVFNTSTNQFDFYMRTFFGRKIIEKVHREKLVYTQNKDLWKLDINYFHIETLKLYSIVLRDGWKRQDLFSHLISQRIKLNIF